MRTRPPRRTRNRPPRTDRPHDASTSRLPASRGAAVVLAIGVAALLAALVPACAGSSSGGRAGGPEIDRAFGTDAPHYLLASGVVDGRPWAFYGGRKVGGSPSIGFVNDVFRSGGQSFPVPDGFTAPDFADARALQGTVHGDDGAYQDFDAIVGFAPRPARAIVLREPDGERMRAPAVRLPGIPSVRFFVFTGPAIADGEWDVAVYTGSGRLLRAPCPSSKRIPCPSPPPTSLG